MKNIIFFIAAYLCGSFPTGVVIGKKFYNIDIREHGSKNMGGTNAGRVLGKKAGFIVSFIDVIKVFLPVLIAKQFLSFQAAAFVGVCALLGHCYPIFANFKGGKGVSSFFGIIFALDFILGIILLIIWKTLKHVTNYVSVASMTSCFIISFIFYYKYRNIKLFLVLILLSFFIVYLHRSNIKRLLSGTENKVNPNR
ncbi:glycerol-3-phosphate 1-O-acyltransferase PlsY [Thermobrachium celere]|uniref:Glycerol-3-phosphate acyltransferase n=1 Tax=Thermobrachium celere DSM 8682 TaxID=941824 RepID=R7RR53_9CLOT|nr:glycerol-3-phosphate 1-O-acyltransferase PlsY [Thermobrachium celere]GFR34955.1 glycerol-3-phosphate acyltransferase [Thermobrachium celere]CDF57783.1 Acyl-phosphate:glycerol-3-phosphate O-acyltransferase PlsY [Thermobrachium celere DSM 8682]